MSSKYMEEAIALAIENVRSGKGGPFGCVIVRDDRIVGRGTNQVTATSDPTAHAEIVAIRDACATLGSFQLDGCDIYATSEPCPMCLGAIYWARPRRVFFAASRGEAAAAGFDDDYIYRQMALPAPERNLQMRQLPVDGATDVFQAWLDFKDRVEY